MNTVDPRSTAARASANGHGTSALKNRRSTLAADQSALREHNLSVVLREILDSPGRTTRAKIAQKVGLTRASVSGLADLLIRHGLVVETENEEVSRAGRPGVLLTPRGGFVAALGMLIQVDRLAVQAIDFAGTVLASGSASGDYRNSDPARAVADLAEIARPVLDDLTARGIRLAGVAVAVPGIIADATLVRIAPNLGWESVDVGALVREALGLDQRAFVEVANDADLGVLAEMRTRLIDLRQRRGDQNYLFVAGQVGIGGAVVHRGRLSVGANGSGSEVGHIVVSPDGPRCGCGATGCLEAYAGKYAVLTAAGLDLDTPVDDLLADPSPPVREALDRAATALGVALSTALNIVDVPTVVLGGIYATWYDRLHPAITDELTARVLAARWVPVSVERSSAGDETLTGAGLRVIDHVVDHPYAWLESRAR